jgi:hypothetical protein
LIGGAIVIAVQAADRCLAPGALRADQEPAAEPPTATDSAPPAEEAQPQPSPDELGPFLVRTYKIKPKKLWKGLLETLQASGYPPEELVEQEMSVKTSFVDFSQKTYSEEVAEPPPRLGSNYHILQMNRVLQGKVSLEAHVASKERGAELRIRARILVQGLDRQKSIRVLVDRRSVGVIEGEFLIKLQEALGLERL